MECLFYSRGGYLSLSLSLSLYLYLSLSLSNETNEPKKKVGEFLFNAELNGITLLNSPVIVEVLSNEGYKRDIR